MQEGAQNSNDLTITSCDDFHQVDSIAELIASEHSSRIFRNDPTRESAIPPWRPRRGVDFFGDGQASEIDGWKFDGLPQWKWTDRPHTREVSTFALEGGVLLPGSMAIISGERQLIYQSIELSDYYGGIDQMEPLISRKMAS